MLRCQPGNGSTSCFLADRAFTSLVCISLLTLLIQFSSDLLVGVKHDSDGSTNCLGWQVFPEVAADCAYVSVGGHALAPDRLVTCAGFAAPCPVDVRNALSMVELGRCTVNASLDVNQGLTLVLSSLTASETSENSFLVESMLKTTLGLTRISSSTYLTGA